LEDYLRGFPLSSKVAKIFAERQTNQSQFPKKRKKKRRAEKEAEAEGRCLENGEWELTWNFKTCSFL